MQLHFDGSCVLWGESVKGLGKGSSALLDEIF